MYELTCIIKKNLLLGFFSTVLRYSIAKKKTKKIAVDKNRLNFFLNSRTVLLNLTYFLKTIFYIMIIFFLFI